MSEMFKNYPQPEDYIPNNRPRCCPKKGLDMMAGETAFHSFEIPFNVVTDCLDYKVIYKLGIDVILVKSKEQLTVVEEDNSSIINCELSSSETKLFGNTLLSTEVQIKFIMNDGSVSYTDVYKVKVNDSLDDGEAPVPPVPPHIITGIGWTED